MRHLSVEVYKFPLGDCTNGGLSSKHKTLYLVDGSTCRDTLVSYCKRALIPVERALVLVRRELFGGKAYYCEPLLKPEHKNQMHGGNFVFTSDSRFRDITGCYHPIPVHDRFDEWR